jgi:hypothetical protein
MGHTTALEIQAASQSGAMKTSALSVSTIIPSYNRANYLPLALDSVLGQTHPVTEIIIVDDGSTDNTPEVVTQYEGRIRFCQENHGGVSAARNKGLELAQGEIIAWCDADDVWESTFLQHTVSLLEDDPRLDGVYTGVVHIDSNGQRLPQENCVVVPPDRLYAALADDCFIQTTGFVMRKRCFDQAGWFDTNFDISEDYDMFLRLAQHCCIRGIGEPLVQYRVHSQNTVGNAGKWCESRLALTRKHFGDPRQGIMDLTAQQRRAHAYAYRAAAIRSLQDGADDQGWQYLRQSVLLWPEILSQLSTLYELVCGPQPPGLRGDAARLNLPQREADMLQHLNDLFRPADATLAPQRSIAYGNTYLTLGILSDRAGDQAAARHSLWTALRYHPQFLFNYPFMRRLLKVSIGLKRRTTTA